jgi:hypothetical protein
VDYASRPIEVVNAPIEVVWNLLTNPAGWGGFFDLRVLGVDPAGQAQVGQRVRAETGSRWLHLKFGFKFTEIDAWRHRLGLDVELPFGIRVREEIDCALVSVGSCRVNYYCNFEFPSGIRGRVVRLLVRRGLDTGPRDSLRRLKRAAETAAG